MAWNLVLGEGFSSLEHNFPVLMLQIKQTPRPLTSSTLNHTLQPTVAPLAPLRIGPLVPLLVFSANGLRNVYSNARNSFGVIPSSRHKKEKKKGRGGGKKEGKIQALEHTQSFEPLNIVCIRLIKLHIHGTLCEERTLRVDVAPIMGV